MRGTLGGETDGARYTAPGTVFRHASGTLSSGACSPNPEYSRPRRPVWLRRTGPLPISPGARRHRAETAGAGQEGLEPPTSGFGDRRSTNWSYWPLGRADLLLSLLVRRMRAARAAELAKLELRLLLRTLRRTVIPTTARRALHEDRVSGHSVSARVPRPTGPTARDPFGPRAVAGLSPVPGRLRSAVPLTTRAAQRWGRQATGSSSPRRHPPSCLPRGWRSAASPPWRRAI